MPDTRSDPYQVETALVDGKPADKLAMESLKSCRWVEEINGTALLTERGVKAALALVNGQASHVDGAD